MPLVDHEIVFSPEASSIANFHYGLWHPTVRWVYAIDLQALNSTATTGPGATTADVVGWVVFSLSTFLAVVTAVIVVAVVRPW